MSITLEEAQHLTRLSRLQMDEAEQEQFQSDLNQLLKLFEELKSVDTSDYLPLAHPLSVREEVWLRLRQDAVTEQSSEDVRSELMQNAPASDKGLFLVPKVIE